MKEKLESLSIRWKELEEEIQDPALIKNQNRYKEAMREHAYLSKLMEEYAQYLRGKRHWANPHNDAGGNRP